MWRGKPAPPTHAHAIGIGLQARGVNAVDRKLLVAVFGIAGHADRAYDFAFGIADEHAAALRKNLIAARGDKVSHENWPLLRSFADQFRTPPERKRRISFAVGHFEPDHRRPVFFLEGFHFAARLYHDHAQWPAIQCRTALDNGIDNAFGLIECDGGQWTLPALLCQLPARDSIAVRHTGVSPLA